MAPVNEQITALERCEQAVERVLSRMQRPCLLDFNSREHAPAQAPLESESAPAPQSLQPAA